MTAAYFGSGGNVQVPTVLRRIVAFPPFQAFVLALLLKPLELSAEVDTNLTRLGSLLASLATLSSVGVQLQLADRHGLGQALTAAVAYKLVLAPVLAALVVFGLLQMHSRTREIIVFQASMGLQVAGAIVASEFKLTPPLSVLVAGVGTAISMVTIVAWYWLAQAL
jgi:predicted permease